MRLIIIKPTHEEIVGYILISLVCAFVAFAAWWDKVLPEAKLGISTALDEFAEQRSDEVIRYLAVNVGMRVVGHSDPINTTVDFLMSKFQEMNEGVSKSTRVVDLEQDYGLPGDGASSARYYWEYCCRDKDEKYPRNVVARLRRQGSPLPSPRKPLLLLTAHLDTVEGSPGATDDAFGVGVVMETARALLRHVNHVSLPMLGQWEMMVALFDGEEYGFLGSRQFMAEYLMTNGTSTRHPTVVVLNAEGSGSAVGKSSLLRSLKGSGWLAGFFMRHSPRPYGSSLTQFLFDVLAVANTDIDALSELKNVHAIDVLPLDARWNYHCPTDGYGQIARGAQQYAGENYLAVTRNLLAWDPATAIPSNQREGSSRHIYFGFLGLFNILVMSHRMKMIFDVVTVGVFMSVWVFMRRRGGKGIRLTLLRCVGCFISSLVLAVLVLVVVDTFLMRASGKIPRCYIDNPWITFNLIRIATYLVVPTLASVLLEIPLTKRLWFSAAEEDDWEVCMGIFQCVVMVLGFFSSFVQELTFINLVSLACLCLVWVMDYAFAAHNKEQLLRQLPLIVIRQSVLVIPAGFLFADMLQMIAGKLPFYAEHPGQMVPIVMGIFIGMLFMPLVRLACYGKRSNPHPSPSNEAETVKLPQVEGSRVSIFGGLLFAVVLACSCLVWCIVIKAKIPY